MTAAEHRLEVDVFGGRTSILVAGAAPDGTTPQLAALRAAARLRRIHTALTRFDPGSELARLNADPRWVVPASPLLCALARAIGTAGELSGGLVDATVLPALEAAGYALSRSVQPAPALDPLVPTSGAGARPAVPDPRAAWSQVVVGPDGESVGRPPGLRLDGGGLVKGLACDLLARSLARHRLFGVDCDGDLRTGGAAGATRRILVASPFGGEPVAEHVLRDGAAATSGLVRRWWRGERGAAHHLIDPGRGVPAFTGVVQATALAPTALEAEIRAKTALLSGPRAAGGHLPHGGTLVLADGSVRHVGVAQQAAA